VKSKGSKTIAAKATAQKRAKPRRAIEPLEITSISILENLAKLARKAQIVDASVTGFQLRVKRENLIPKVLRQNLTLEPLVGTTLLIYIDQMNLEISGTVVRTKLLGKEGFEIGVDYRDDAPQYWRECMLDLIPMPGELDEN
jgi:hypothetical protein